MTYELPLIPTTPLTEDEIDRICLLLGYSRNNPVIDNRVKLLTSTRVYNLRLCLSEIDRNDLLLKDASLSSEVLKTRHITLNPGFRDSLKLILIEEVIKISNILQLEILNNFYLLSDSGNFSARTVR